MSDHENAPSSPSRHTWWLLVLVAVPLLYLLTLPPLAHFLEKRGYDDMDSLPAVLRLYFTPGVWLYHTPPVGDVMERYTEWWDDILEA